MNMSSWSIPIFPSIRSPIIGNGFRNIIVTTPCLDIFNPIRISPFFECQLALGFGLELVWDNFPGVYLFMLISTSFNFQRSGFTKSFLTDANIQKFRTAEFIRNPDSPNPIEVQKSRVFKSIRNPWFSNLPEI